MVAMGRRNTCSQPSCVSLAGWFRARNSIQTKLRPCLGSDRVLPFWLILDGKYCPINWLAHCAKPQNYFRTAWIEMGSTFM